MGLRAYAKCVCVCVCVCVCGGGGGLIPLVVRSKVYVFGSLITGIVFSNTLEGMDITALCSLCVGLRFQRSPKLRRVYSRVSSRNLKGKVA
jgi:hypothetical protein